MAVGKDDLANGSRVYATQVMAGTPGPERKEKSPGVPMSSVVYSRARSTFKNFCLASSARLSRSAPSALAHLSMVRLSTSRLSSQETKHIKVSGKYGVSPKSRSVRPHIVRCLPGR
jgi:hypothetical protein